MKASKTSVATSVYIMYVLLLIVTVALANYWYWPNSAKSGQTEETPTAVVASKDELRVNKCKTKANYWLIRLRKGFEFTEIALDALREEADKCGLALADIGTSEQELEEIRVKGRKAAAKKNLANLRQGSDFDTMDFHLLRNNITEGGFTLADIGTSEEEIKQLQTRSYKAEAIKRLSALREDAHIRRSSLYYLSEKIAEGWFTLSDIGTSRQELEELRIRAHKVAAMRWLVFLREGSDHYATDLFFLRKNVAEGRFTLADLGTSEEEIEQLRIKGCRIAAIKWLAYLREGSTQYKPFLEYLRKEVAKGGFTFSDIGTSESELFYLKLKNRIVTALSF